MECTYGCQRTIRLTKTISIFPTPQPAPEAFNARGSFRIPLTVRDFIPPVRFQLAVSHGLFTYPTRLQVNLWGDKLAAMLEQMAQEPLIYDYVRGYF